MTDKVKKLVLINLPYLIFVYLFDKLCQGVRLSPGAAASEKLLHIGQGFSAAFASLAPSFHLLDLCVGRRRRGADPAGGLLQGQEREEIPPGDRVRERPLGHPGRHRPLCGPGLFPECPSHPDGADHHVEPPERAQVRKK